MTRPKADPQLFAAGHLINNLATVWQTVMDHYRRELSILDGYPAGDSDTPRVTASAELTSVERYAARRLSIEADRAQLLEDRQFLLDVLANMVARCNKAIGTRAETPRCTGGVGREGHIEWGDPTCTNVPSRRELCDRCRMAERRWRERHGLTQRDEAA